MMREILFRGKRMDNSEWLYGVYFPEPATIFHGEQYSLGSYVKANTVGQFTGLTDKNGKKIFEGDVVTSRHGIMWVVDFQLNAFVAMDGETVQFALFEQYDWNYKTGEAIAPDYFEVIGNIHDNPELLEGV